VVATWQQKQEVHGPPAYFTPDWEAARASVALLASLAPEVAATGHGIAMHGDELRRQLQELRDYFQTRAVPTQGRYVGHPAVADASGVVSVPPPLGSPWVKGLVVAGLIGAVVALLRRRSA